jgi:glycosyltransferase involved in cell wall biosynthesis
LHRVLFVESYPHVIFGQQRTMLSLLEGCGAARIAPVVGVTGEGLFVDAVRQRGLLVECFRYPGMLARYGGAIYRYRGLDRARMGFQLLGYLRTIRRRLRELALDAVFCNDMRGLLTVGAAARTLGLPVMTWDKLDKPHGWLDFLQLPLVNVNAIISDAVVAKYPRWQRRWFSRKIVRVFNGADLSRFDRAREKQRELPAGPNDVVLGLIGTITERKGHDRLLAVFPEACRRFPRLRLFVIGDTSGSDEDERYVKSLPNLDHPRVHLLGMREDVPDLLKSIDILVVPSRHEGMGQVTVEAMAAGRPVIGARAGGIPEVVLDGETGLLFDGEDRGQLLACIERLSASSELRARMGEAGRRRAEAHFNRPVQMRKILALCVEMIEGRKNPSRAGTQRAPSRTFPGE